MNKNTNLHSKDLDEKRFEQLKRKIIEIFKNHEIDLPDIEIDFSDEKTPIYRPVGAEFGYCSGDKKNQVPLIQLAIPVETDERYIYPMIAYQLSHEYTHAYIHRCVFQGSSNFINELLAEATSHLCLIELGFREYEVEARQGQAITPRKLYDYIMTRKDKIYKNYSDVYGENGCYLGLITNHIDVWRLVKKFKSILNVQNSTCEYDLQFIYESGFFKELE